MACATLGAVGTVTFGGGPASAQTFFQQIFGYGPARPYAASRPRLPQGAPFAASGLRGFYSPYGRSLLPYQSYRRYSDDELGYAQGGRTYQTMCVRMCDGYYWPISASATRGRFHIDAALCSSSCEGEARLFYRPNLGEDPEAMTDLSGRIYAQLPTAFRYRKSLVKGCTCRAAPWSEAELGRHRRYAWTANPPADWRRADVNAEAVAGYYGDSAAASPPPVSQYPSDEAEPGAGSQSGEREDTIAPLPEASSFSAPGSVLRPVPRRIFNVRAYPSRGWSPSRPPRYRWPGDVRRNGY